MTHCAFVEDESSAPDTEGVVVELADLNLDVYDRGDGPWSPEHGDVTIPDGWELLPTGDAFVTRRVKATGRYWLA